MSTPDVLVPQADSLGTVAVIRSLGRARYRVHAVSTRADALGLQSRFAYRSVVSPPYSERGYVPWLRDYVRKHRISAIVPSESFILALGAARPEFLPLIPFATDERVLLDAMSKYALFEDLVARAAPHLPPTLLVPDLRAAPSEEELERLGPPLYVKVDACSSLDGSPGVTHCAASAAEARTVLLRLQNRFSRAVVHGHVPGQGVAAFFLSARGEILAEMMHRRVHEVPYTGGISSLRETWRHEAILKDARDKLRAARWEGVAMMEYRWDPATDGFAFIEMNARFWGSLHLALYAGVDFPRLLLEAWQGLPVAAPRPRLGLRCRHLPDEIRHVWSKLKARELRPRVKLAAAAELVAVTLDPRVRSDLWFPGDAALFWSGLAQFRASLRAQRAGGRTPAAGDRDLAPPEKGSFMRGKLMACRMGKAMGLFALSRLLTRRKLRILAYHGIELCDEGGFSPSMFIRAGTFAERLELLRRRYPVLPLGEAVRRLKDGTLPPCAVAITIDDGFHSTAGVAAPLLRAAGLPATVYVTTYYTQRDVPVFRLAMQYCFWKTRSGSLDVGKLVAGVEGTASLGTDAAKFEIAWELINYGERHLDEEGRTRLLEATSAELGVDLAPLLRHRFLHLMTPGELRATAGDIDVQLHTHRHRFPDDPLQVRAEIEENRRALAPLVPGPLVHLCYPSGFWSEALFPALAAAGIETATTCEGGFNGRDVHPYALRRFFDGEHITGLEFEAELSGFAELLRTVASWLGRARPRVRIDEADRRRGYPAGHGRTILERGAPTRVPA